MYWINCILFLDEEVEFVGIGFEVKSDFFLFILYKLIFYLGGFFMFLLEI